MLYYTPLLVCDLKQDVTPFGQLTTLPISAADEQVSPTPSHTQHCLSVKQVWHGSLVLLEDTLPTLAVSGDIGRVTIARDDSKQKKEHREEKHCQV